MTNKIEIVEHGLMMSDYFHGTSGVWLNIYPTPETTKKEALEMLKNEINNVQDHIEYVFEYHGFKGNLDYKINNILDEMNMQKIRFIFSQQNLQKNKR